MGADRQPYGVDGEFSARSQEIETGEVVGFQSL
jgi:hypothetical protein